MRKCAVLLLVVCCAMFAIAQEQKAEVFGGWQDLNVGARGSRVNFSTGWDADGAVSLTKHIGVTGDVAGSYKDGVHVHSFMGGPRFTTRKDIFRPFAEGLIGFAHSSAGDLGSSNNFSFGLGGGLDLDVNKHVALRVGKFDYIFVKDSEANLNNFRFATGVVLKF